MILPIYYFITFAYSNINPFGVDYGYTHYNVIPSYWLQAMQFLNQTKAQYNTAIFLSNSTQLNLNGSFVLSWWDYGDWINWYGNSKSVLRGDNQQPLLDEATAFQYINGNTTTLKAFMQQENASLVIFSSDDFQKYQALNYLSCVYQNNTNVNTPIGTSPCELANMPTYLIFPQNLTNINDFCSFSNINLTYIKSVSNSGIQYCLQELQTTTQGNQLDGKIYTINGTLVNNTNMIPMGVQPINNVDYEVYLMEYMPLNTTTCQMPSGIPLFYNSLLYKGEFMGCLNGFKQVYPSGNGFGAVRIYAFANTTS